MSHIEVVNRFEQDGFFVVEAEHYHDDGSFWYSEHYRWVSTEGNKRKRLSDADGRLVLDDGSLAPRTTDSTGVSTDTLPEGRQWALRPGPHMDDGSVWSVIIQDHEARREVYAGGRNTLARTPTHGEAEEIASGNTALLTRFADVVGDVVEL